MAVPSVNAASALFVGPEPVLVAEQPIVTSSADHALWGVAQLAGGAGWSILLPLIGPAMVQLPAQL
jgi:hypothetical protein